MDIFISWSGERSKAVAEALKKWIPFFIHATKPWMSASDIDPGERWNLKVAEQLQKSKIGILCLTPENLNAPWLIFEAGALSKTIEMTFVCPYLYEVSKRELLGPLSQFQAATTEKEETRRLIQTINNALGPDAIAPDVLNKVFNRWWPDLKKEFKKVPPLEVVTDHPRRDDVLRHTSRALKELARER